MPIRFMFMIALLIGATACSSGGTTTAAASSQVQQAGGSNALATLPPEPDRAANNATLAGIDSTGTGVRDDVYRWIFQSYTSTRKRNALVQSAKAFRKIYLNPPKNTAEALTIAKDVHRAGDCFFSYEAAGYLTLKDIHYFSANIQAMHADTKARVNVYSEYNHLLDGTGGPLGPTAGTCDAGGGL